MNKQSIASFTSGLGPRIRAGFTGFAKGKRGSILMETVIALITFVLVGTAVLRGVSTTFISGANTENQSISDNIARNQLELLASQPFQADATNYPIVATPDGYAVVVPAVPLLTEDPTEIQKLIVTVSTARISGDVGEEILRLETVKAIIL